MTMNKPPLALVPTLLLAGLLTVLTVLTGCATQPAKPYDYSAYKESQPRSILVLPPVNASPDVNAVASVLAQTTQPLAESGYYVFPVALVSETFRQNGLTEPADMHAVPPARLREIFGADTALLITVTSYGTRYLVVDSETVVTAEAKLIDLRSGATLWNGSATASSNEGRNNNS